MNSSPAPSIPAHLVRILHLGWEIFPVRGKVPLTSNGFKGASKDPVRWLDWQKEFPGCGWAAPTGESNGFDAVDADTPEGVADCEARLPLGPRVRTGRGGMHFYLKHEGRARNWTKRIPGCDFRGEGGYVVLPGSIHENGQPYEWVEGTADLPLPDAPQWLRELLQKAPEAARSGPPYKEGERNQRLFEMGCAIRAKGHEVLPELRRRNINFCLPPLEDAEVVQIAESVTRYPAVAVASPPEEVSGATGDDDGDKKPCRESYVEFPDGRVAEEILTSTGPAFLVFSPDPEAWVVEPTLDIEGEKVYPMPVPAGLRGALTLADGVEGYGSTGQLLAELEAWGLEAYDPVREGPIFRLWVRLALASWILDGFYRNSGDRFAPVLPTICPPESGKGRLLLVLRFLSYRSLYLLKTTRVPSIFRALEGWNGTLILDEADVGSSTEASEFIEFLNARAYGVPILRYASDTARMTYFNSFGMTVIAIRKAYEDAGFNSRTVPLRAEVTGKVSEIDLVAAQDWLGRGRVLLRKLLLWRLRHIRLIRTGKLCLPTRANFPKVEAFRVRAAVLPLLALKEEEPEIARDLGDLAAEIQSRLVTERADSPEGVLLGFIHDRLGAEGFEASRDEQGFRIEEVRTERTGEEEPITHRVPLTARGVSESLGKELSNRTVSRLWRALGQTIKARARYPGALYPSLLLITDPERLDREFARFVPNAQSKADLFRVHSFQTTLTDTPERSLAEQTEHPEQTRSGTPPPPHDVQPVQDVQAGPTHLGQR
ncbi:MAG TPA: bifunctional DNA primase/polymerase [Thermoplasmata archaeon]|nr:bifunctional DNA primase/polymerase [Thermoplasmata archaeon]